MFTNLQIPAGRRPLTRGEAISTGIFLVLVLGIMLFGLLQDFKPANASIFFMIIFWGLLLVLHELGHAIAAWALGWKVGEISIGFGPQIYFKRWGKTDVRIRLVPLEGFVRPAPRSTGWARTKKSIIFAAGPGIEFLLLAIMIGIFGWDSVFNSSQDYFSIALKSLAAVIIFGGGLQLIPFSTGGSVSDGMGILTSAFTKSEDLRDHQYALEFEEVKHLFRSEDPTAVRTAEQIVGQLKQSAPSSFRIAFLDAKLDLALGRHDDCIRKTNDLIRSNELTDQQNAKLELHFLIVLAELDRDPPGYDEASFAVKNMTAIFPSSPLAKAAEGMLAVRRRHAKRGGEILSDVFQIQNNPTLDPVILAHLAIAARQLKDLNATQRFLNAFASYPTEKRLRDQLNRLIGSA